MKSSIDSKLLQEYQNRIYMIYACFLISIGLLALFNVQPAFSLPPPGSVSVWSDVAFIGDSDEYDFSNPDPGCIVGIGCTEANYYYPDYDYWVNTTVTGSDGTSTTLNSYRDPFCTRADVYLQIQGAGTYNVDTLHYSISNSTGAEEYIGCTHTSAELLGSQDVYYKLTEQVGPVGNGTIDCYYVVCNDYRNNICNRTNFVIRQTIWFEGNCAEFIRIIWYKYRIPFIGITHCSRSLPVRIPWNPCPNG